MGKAPLAAHVRRFPALSMRIILYLQAEIQFWERRLLIAETRDSQRSQGNESSFARNWQYLKGSADSENKEQYEVFQKLLPLMKDYEDAILRYRVLAETDVNSHHLKEIQKILNRTDMCDTCLSGVDALIWGSTQDPEGYASDLMAISPGRTQGPLARWIAEKLVSWFFIRFHFRFKKEDRDGFFSYDQRFLYSVISCITNAAASFISYGAIASLYFARSAVAQLVVALCFSAIISLGMVVIGGEGFTGTAAFAAIMAALIANNNNCSGHG